MEAFLWKLQNELKAWRRLQVYNFTCGEQARNMKARIEMAKVTDEMEIKFGHTGWMQALAEEHY